MAKETLVGLDIDLGAKAIRALDAAGYPVTVAVWLLTEEWGEWRLLIATPLYDKLGLKEAYLQLVTALSSTASELVHEVPIIVKGNRNGFVRHLRNTFGATAAVTGMRLGGQTIGDVWVEDAYVYRIC